MLTLAILGQVESGKTRDGGKVDDEARSVGRRRKEEGGKAGEGAEAASTMQPGRSFAV